MSINLKSQLIKGVISTRAFYNFSISRKIRQHVFGDASSQAQSIDGRVLNIVQIIAKES
jgi:hypothetical protein